MPLPRLFRSLAPPALLALGGCSRASEPPPIVLISIDTLRADALGAYGQARPTSPAFDAFAEEAWVFERAYAQGAQTAPSHATLFTGLMPSVHQVSNREVEKRARQGEPVENPFYFPRKLAANVTTLAEALRDAGWHTAAFVAGGNLNRECGHDQVFELWDQDESNGMNGNLERLFDVAVAERWIEEHKDERFLLFLHTYIPHSPYLPPAPWNTQFDPDYRGNIVSDREAYPVGGPLKYSERTTKFWGGVNRDDARDIEHLRALYDGDVRYGDAALAQMLDALKRSGVYERAIVIVLSDHGEEFKEHGRFEHPGELYGEHVHVPLAIRLPPSVHGGGRGRIAVPVKLADVMPTVLELAGVPLPQAVQGMSLVPYLEDRGSAVPAISESVLRWTPANDDGPLVPHHWIRSVRTPSWTYLERMNGGERSEELYDVQRDPLERTNLAADPAREKELAAFRQQLEAHAAHCRLLAERLAGREPAPMSAETEEALRALGYFQDGK